MRPISDGAVSDRAIIITFSISSLNRYPSPGLDASFVNALLKPFRIVEKRGYCIAVKYAVFECIHSLSPDESANRGINHGEAGLTLSADNWFVNLTKTFAGPTPWRSI